MKHPTNAALQLTSNTVDNKQLRYSVGTKDKRCLIFRKINSI